LLAGIENERLIPLDTLPLRNERFQDDLHQLQSHLSPQQAAYILLKTNPDAPNGYAAITFVPNHAPVRQKMLFASTRLTLLRELGLERFSQQIFATEMEELTAEGWRRHEAHVGLDAPLTEEESGLKDVRDAEASESQGTTGRRGHVSGKVDVSTGEGVVEALASLREEGCRGTLVQLKFVLPDETLRLDSSTDGVQPSDVGTTISATEPRYSFYSHPDAPSESEILFIYTCPSSSKIKERMVYSTGKSWTRTVAERDAGIIVSKSLEATEPSELTLGVAGGGGRGETEVEQGSRPPSSGFARPKRPGRR